MQFTDQMGRTITLERKPQRIVSIVPSQTELLFDLGLNEEVVGITKFCVHPQAMFRTRPRVGGTKKLDFEKIKALQPDLIIGNKEENQKEQVQELMKHYPVWMSDIYTLDDALQMIGSVGELTGTEAKANEIAGNIRKGFEEFRSTLLQTCLPELSPRSGRQAAYFIWKDPYMAAGSNTFIDHILRTCGLENVFSQRARYPEIKPEDIRAASPQLILLSSEPYPFKEKHIEEFRNICPGAKIMVVDGEMFSWYGSRLQHAPAYLREVLNAAGKGT
jgi:ABC-type Fe3+-hydroxamate transport system substrate-binding protein